MCKTLRVTVIVVINDPATGQHLFGGMAQQTAATEQIDHRVNLSLHLSKRFRKRPDEIPLLPHKRKRRTFINPAHSA